MKRQKSLVSVLCGVWIAGGLSGCGVTAGGVFLQESQESAAVLAAACDGIASAEAIDQERFKPYEQFGLVYNPDKNELQYNGRQVRWFEDYYAIPDAGQAGTDFFNENGVVDVYAAFGVTYDAKDDQWYFDGEKVRFCRDVLISNGESLTGGKFKGAIRTFESRNGGVVDIYTVRDFANRNADGYGTLTGIEKYSH